MDATQNGQPAHLQPRRAPNKARTTKPPAVQANVIAEYSLGKSKTQISNDLGLARNTVTAILSANEIEQRIIEGRSRAISLIPRSLDTIEYRLDKHDGNVAMGILRGTQVLVNQPITANVTNNFAFMLAQLKQSEASEQVVIEVTANELPKKD